jgi:hypothetical protein
LDIERASSFIKYTTLNKVLYFYTNILYSISLCILFFSYPYVLQLCFKIPVGKGKYGCKYCNECPKIQLVEVSINSGIASLNEKKTLNAISTFQKDPSKWFGYL